MGQHAIKLAKNEIRSAMDRLKWANECLKADPAAFNKDKALEQIEAAKTHASLAADLVK